MAEPIIEVLVPDEMTDQAYGASGQIYPPWLLMQTHRLLPRTVCIPDDVRSSIESVYAAPKDVSNEWARMVFGNQLNAAQAQACELPPPDAERFFGWDLADGIFSMEERDEMVCAKTRLSAPSIRVALLTDDQMERAQCALPHPQLAQEVLMNSFTMRADVREMQNCIQGQGLLRDVVLMQEDALPVQLGDMLLDYDPALGAIVQRREKA